MDILSEEKYTEDGFLVHVIKEGSRRHVLYYTSKGVHCSEPNCITNKHNQLDTNNTICI